MFSTLLRASESERERELTYHDRVRIDDGASGFDITADGSDGADDSEEGNESEQELRHGGVAASRCVRDEGDGAMRADVGRDDAASLALALRSNQPDSLLNAALS